MIIELVAPDKMCYDVNVEVIPRKEEYLRYITKNGFQVEGVVLEVAHSLSESSQSISVILRPL